MATKSKGVGRGHGSGGARSGAGRKPKHKITVKQAERRVEDAAQIIVQARQEPVSSMTAADLVAKAYATLQDVMDNSPFPAPRVTAARAILDIAREEKAEKAGTGGKKAERQAAAEKVGGKFSAPSAPRLIVDNR